MAANAAGAKGAKKQDDLLIDNFSHSVIIGTLLGDSRIERQKISYNSRLCFEQGDVHKDYLFHLFDIFKPFTNLDTPSFRSRIHKVNGNINNTFYFGALGAGRESGQNSFLSLF